MLGPGELVLGTLLLLLQEDADCCAYSSSRMAEWLKKQAELDGQKDQRRLERLQSKLQPPRHQFSDTEYQQQCHELSERLEDSVLKGSAEH